jgi:hypothetical protein
MNAKAARDVKENGMQREALFSVETHPDPLAGGDPWLTQLVAAVGELHQGDSSFAKASVLYPEDMGEWQAAVYLLSGSWVVWERLGTVVMESRSIGPVIEELEEPTYAWSGGEREVLVWAAHFWDLQGQPAHFPYRFDSVNFHRWVVACHLRKGVAPQLGRGELA